MYQNFRKIILIIFLIKVSQCFGLIRGSEDEKEKSSLVFVFDTTGSMYNDLRQLREGAEMILNTALEEGNIIGDFVFVPFHDPTVGPPTVTTDKEVFKKALEAVHVYGGGDCPEKSLTGIQLALNVSASNSYVYVFTDATAGDHRFVGKVLDSVQRKQSQIVFVLTGHCNDLDRPSYKVYQQIAAASSGQVFNLNKTSVHKVLDFVKSSIKGKMVNLGTSVNPPGHNYTQGVPVDSTLGEVTVSVSGAKPQITVVNPSGEQITGPPQLVTALDLSEIMVVKVLQPEPGNWTITVGSEEEYSVKVVGLSNLTFNHGFSVEKPRSMAETSYRPLQGTYNHMMLSLTQTDIPVDIDYAEVLAMNGTALFEVPLKLVDKENKVYMADPFIPPEDFFYIAIKGRDQYNQELRRVGTTAVQAKSPDIPYLSSPGKIQAHAHSRVVLKCRVESLVPVTAMWTKDTYKIQPKISSLQTTSIEYVIEDMKEENVGIYRCVASNVAGLSRAATDVTLIVDPPQVTIQPENTTLDIGQNITITCTVFSEALLTKFDFISRTSTTNFTKVQTIPNIDGRYSFSKTLLNVNETDAGAYECIAANRGGTSQQTTQITIQSKPSVQIIPPPNLTVLQNSTTSLICHVTNAHIVKWFAPNNTVIREVDLRDVNGSDDYLDDILNVRVSDDGFWKCVGLRGEFEASDSVELKTFLKPTVSIKQAKNITIVNGTTYDVICEALAKPQPAVQWFKGMEPLGNNLSQVSTNVYQSTLTLNTSSDVSGNYTCVGFNAEGMANDTITVNVRRKLTLKQRFKDASVQLYSQFELHCLTDSDPTPKLTWYHNETELHIESNVFLNDDNSTLYITSVDFHNLGTYACKADNGYETVFVNGSLSVYGLEYPAIMKTPTQLTVKQGESAVVTCRVTKGNPEPSIKWQFKNASSEKFVDLRSGEIESELLLRNVSTRNAGIYRCIAANVLGNDTYDVELVVHYAPVFKNNSNKNKTDTPLELKSGETVEFSCESIGSPPPIVTWTKDGLPLRFSDNIQVSNSDKLTITNATEYNSGVYICNATSTIGAITKNFTLFVYEAPTISSSMIGDDDSPIEVLEGQLVELPCKVQGVPKPKVSWLHNGEAIDNGRIVIDESGIRFIANLTDFGEFTCLATNKYGNSSANYTLYIWVPPYIKPPLETTKDVKTEENVTLQCDVVGFPIPSVQWKFKDQMLKENTTDISFNELGSIYLSNISTKHEGLYTCITENIAGVAEKYIYLSVNEPPKILQDNYTGPYLATNMDTALTISCKATGKPKPFVVWITDDYINLSKDPRYTVEMDGTLTIKSPSEDMSGNYICIAENYIGKVNKTVAVEIYSLPSQQQSDETHTKVTIVEDSDANIECPIRASTTDTVKWYKDAQLISTGNLQIPKINRFNQTSYACVLSNAVGSAYSTVNIVVEWPPKFITDDDKKQNKGDEDKMNDELEMLDDVENPYSGLETFDNELEVKNEADVLDVVKGDDAYLDCRVDAKPDAKVKWLYNSKPILFEDKDRLKFLNVQQSQAGSYKCIVSNVHGTIVKDFNLNVLAPPFISYFDVLDVNLMEGMNATLDCNAKGYPEPNIRWTYNNSNWHLDDSTLTAFNVSLQYEGIYRCDATNKAGSTHIVYRVSVVSHAKVTEVISFTNGLGVNVEDTVEAELGSHIRIACKTSGKPTPIIHWVRNGKVVGENSPDISYADLVLDVASSHAGGYSCMASNEGGSDRRDVKLEVLEPPKIFKSLLHNAIEDVIHLELLSGQAFFLHCHPYGNPLPEVYWFKDDLPLKLFDESMVSKEFGEIIEVTNALEEQSGNYTCVARNKVGNTSIVYLVDVLVPPPQPKESSKQVHIRAGKQLNVTCPVQGSPTPYVMWIKHPYTEINGDTPRVTLLNHNVTLLINQTHISDSGNYSCIMTNKAGTTEFVFTISVEKPPSIGGGSDVIENHRVNMRRSIVLKCEADGHPLPKITWLKETQEISPRLSNVHLVLGNSLLAIWSVSSRDAGQYICVAENVAGVTHRRYNLAVLVPGKWSQWGQWSFCNVTCGLGHQLRSRSCQYIDDNDVTYDKTSNSEKIIVDESACKGPATERRKCHLPPCEEESPQGSWSVWSKWSVCSSSCGFGTQARTRRCRTVCTGDNVQVRKCPNLPPCDNDRRSNNDVYDNSSNNNDNDANDNDNNVKDPEYTPEAVFEVVPKIVNPQYPDDANNLYLPSAATEAPEYYEVNVTNNLDGSEPGPCSVGFFYESITGVCDDVDECLVDNNECHSTQVCTNIEGGYRCSCPAGFAALGIGQRCMDINECTQETSGCEFACVNVAGGYVCACPADMRLHRDKHHCYTVSSLKRTFSYEDIDPEYLGTSIEYPARYKHIR